MIERGHSPENQPEEAFSWHFVPAAPEEVAEARHSLAVTRRFTERQDAINLAISEFAGNFFRHGAIVPGTLQAIRYGTMARLEVTIPGLSPVEREFMRNFWNAGSIEQAYELMGRRFAGERLFDDGAHDKVADLSEGGRGSLMVFMTADRCGFDAYVPADDSGDLDNQPAKIWLEYDLAT